MNSTAVSNEPRFPFPPHHDSAGGVSKYVRYSCTHFIGVSCGVMVGVIDVEAVEVDIADANSK